jgi:hypothetical protein
MSEEPQADFERLRREHAQIEAGIERMREAIEASEPPPPSDFLEEWHALMALVEAHLESEDWLVYPVLLQSLDEDVRLRAERLRFDFGDLRNRVSRYRVTWSPGSIGENWQGFVRDTDELLAALEARIDLEERELAGLELDKAERWSRDFPPIE